jgi:hypothetical protein
VFLKGLIGEKRNNKIWFGGVINKEKIVYYSNKDNYFTFTVINGKIALLKDLMNYFAHKFNNDE